MAKNGWKSELATRLKDGRGTESQASFSARSGVSDRTIGFIENKLVQGKPRIRTVARLAIAAGEDPNEWLQCLGTSIKAQEIEKLKTTIKVHGEVDQFESVANLRRDLMEYIDVRLKALTTRLNNLEVLVHKAKS